MTLKYFQTEINGFTNNTDEFIVLIAYNASISYPYVPGENNYWAIQAFDALDNVYDGIGTEIIDNGLTASYVAMNAGNYYKGKLLIPPGQHVKVSSQNAAVSIYGVFIQGTLEEVAKLL